MAVTSRSLIVVVWSDIPHLRVGAAFAGLIPEA
jgi:hypothetical protein